MTITSESVTDRVVTDFREQGFVHVPALLTAAEVIHYRAAAMDAVGQARTSRDEANTQIISTVDGWKHDPVLRGLAMHARIGQIAERLAGMPLRVWGGEVFVKQPGRSASANPSDDLTFEPPDSQGSLKAWVALVDVPVERGCLTFLPGSHRSPGLRWSPRVTIPLRAGDAAFYHRHTAHSAGANTTDHSRVSFVITYTDIEAT